MTYDVLIDTSVWSMGLRRGDKNPEFASELKKLILEYRVRIIGPIRQEILTGISDFDHFIQLKNRLASFPDLKLTTDHFEYAAELSNKCRSKGVQGSHTDFLICAVSKMNKLAIFTTDKDFEGYSSIIGLALYKTVS